MLFKNSLFSAIFLFGSAFFSNAQTFIPPNMDFELGTTANWVYYRGTVASGHVFSLTPSAPVSGLHTLMSGSGTDVYGGFPVVGHGMYSLKLAHDTNSNNANSAIYNIHVPVGGAYRLDYKYAAVLEDAGHMPSDQPVMKVTAIDSATGVVLNDSLDADPWDPGFTISTLSTTVKYKPWTSASINLMGYGGRTIIVKFVVGGCATAGHFGYGYIDVTGVTMTTATSTPIAGAGREIINVYPNPTSGVLKIQWANQQTGVAELQIVDITGKLVRKSQLKIDSSSGEINIDGLNSGIYFITLNSEHINYSSKVVVQ